MDRDHIATLLPDVIRSAARPGTALEALIACMSALHAPSHAALGFLPEVINPRSCPRRFLPMLIGWLDLDRIFCDDQNVGVTAEDTRTTIPIGHVRELLATAVGLARQRGTLTGLKALLVAATGLSDIRIEEEILDPRGLPRPYHVQVVIAHAGRRHRQLLERIVAEEKPAHVTASLTFREPV